MHLCKQLLTSYRPMLYYAQQITFQEITLRIRQILQYLKNCFALLATLNMFFPNTSLNAMITRKNLIKFALSLLNKGILSVS